MNTLKEEMQRLLDELKETDPTSEEYLQLTKQLAMLSDLDTRKFSISNDTVISAAAQLLGIVLILNFEKLGIMTSRATSFIPRIK